MMATWLWLSGQDGTEHYPSDAHQRYALPPPLGRGVLTSVCGALHSYEPARGLEATGFADVMRSFNECILD